LRNVCASVERQNSHDDSYELGFTIISPFLRDRRKHLAGYLSGESKQMLARCAGARLRSRELIMAEDEPSWAWTPQLVEEIFNI